MAHDGYSDSWPPSSSCNRKLTIRTYGKHLWLHSTTSDFEFVILDEVHCIGDENVAIVDAYCTRHVKPNKLIKMTATPVNKKGAHILGGDDAISALRYPVAQEDVLRKIR
ncbi:unnamed protein product [Arctia plantaginis]|uniref:Helicase ATP-binding domain-containing protein n=1 Tax=Arctia plantaginis TaxID=874455 RepID=A0A8S0ZEK1_ARCPL|nr:unnamed protein product [Arctia plantaginis]CAB3231949.1 unnamed protein product [Arctia plantaginis]